MSEKFLTFFGGVGRATGANILLEWDNKRILVDCGLIQGDLEANQLNESDFAYDPTTIDFLIITHAHMDHIGRVPKLVSDGFRGKIISTIETKELSLPMLEDAYKVMLVRGGSLYEKSDIAQAFSLWEGVGYDEEKELFKNCKLKCINAGHVLGSAICLVTCDSGKEARTIAFTGDLGNSPSPLLPDVEIPKGAHYMVMESVYGDRNHENRDQRKERLRDLILAGIKKQGTIVIPAFSIERTQVILYELNKMIESGELPEVPVFLDSPLALRVTGIYKKYAHDFKKEVRDEIESGDDIFKFPKLIMTHGARESALIENTPDPKIILAGSGMSEGGRIRSHEERILGDAKNTLIMVGYQSVGTLGRRLEDGAKEVKIDGEKIKVEATVAKVDGYSSHMDSEHLVEFVESVKTSPPTPFLDAGEGSQTGLKKVFVIMGEPKSSLFLCQRIRDYVGVEAIFPEEGKKYQLT